MQKIEKELFIPEEFQPGIKKISSILLKNGFECYIVGGAVRDFLLGKKQYDFDFTTNARPNDIIQIFKKTVPTGIKHGTITVLAGGKSFEVTTFRSDGKYFDGRHPEEVHFSDTLEEDIIRRDFTINGLAYDVQKCIIVDYAGGLIDLDKKIIRTIGSSIDRLSEDGLRAYRACRFAAKLNFDIEPSVIESIKQTLSISEKVSAERVRDEFLKTLTSDKPSIGIEYMRVSGLLNLFLPELFNTYGVGQNKYHTYDVYYHCLYSCDAAPANHPVLRLAALFHDIGKPASRSTGTDGEYTFYNHEMISVKIVKNILRRLKFSNEEISRIVNLVRNHMFHYTTDWSDGAVRRFMRKVGVENIGELIELRKADRSGNTSREGLPQQIYELKHRIAKIIEAENAISVKDLKINGNTLMKELNISQGPLIGKLLNDLLEIILDNPELNNEADLIKCAHELFVVE